MYRNDMHCGGLKPVRGEPVFVLRVRYSLIYPKPFKERELGFFLAQNLKTFTGIRSGFKISVLVQGQGAGRSRKRSPA
jgi:hypothetical protein